MKTRHLSLEILIQRTGDQYRPSAKDEERLARIFEKKILTGRKDRGGLGANGERRLRGSSHDNALRGEAENVRTEPACSDPSARSYPALCCLQRKAEEDAQLCIRDVQWA